MKTLYAFGPAGGQRVAILASKQPITALFVKLVKERRITRLHRHLQPVRFVAAHGDGNDRSRSVRDGRMTQVSADELEHVHIDVSLLSPLEQASGPLSPIIGEHGLPVGRKGKRGVLLPQVATERKWDMKTFLEQTCVKTELPKNAWRLPDTMVCSFTALIIEEEG